MSEHNLTTGQVRELAEHLAFDQGINVFQLDDFQEIATQAAVDYDILPEDYEVLEDDLKELSVVLSRARVKLPEVPARQEITQKIPLDLEVGDRIDMEPVFKEMHRRGLIGDDYLDDPDLHYYTYSLALVEEKPDWLPGEYEGGQVRVPHDGGCFFLPRDIDVPVIHHLTKEGN